LDFSPSVGIDRLHPVPTSTDDGATLDWGGTLSEEDKADKKWTISLPKRKPKDKPSLALSKDALERQEVTFSGKDRNTGGHAASHIMSQRESPGSNRSQNLTR
jgi:hypothetical protein